MTCQVKPCFFPHCCAPVLAGSQVEQNAEKDAEEREKGEAGSGEAERGEAKRGESEGEREGGKCQQEGKGQGESQ